MSARSDIERRIEKEKQKLLELRAQIDKSEHFVLGLQEALKFVPQDSHGPQQRAVLQPGSAVKKAEELLRQTGKPMHMTDIVKGIGNPVDSQPSLVSSISRYVKKGVIFKRLGPNTYGLLEWDARAGQKIPIDLPPTFGRETTEQQQTAEHASSNDDEPVEPLF